jgi:hypothetical protein
MKNLKVEWTALEGGAYFHGVLNANDGTSPLTARGAPRIRQCWRLKV